MKDIVQKVTTAGAVIRNGKILIVKRSDDDDAFPGLWEFPSGKKEPMEWVEDSVVREVREETGLKVKVINIIFTFNFTMEKPDKVVDATQLVFLVEAEEDSEVNLSEEHSEFKWIGPDEVDNYNISNETKTAIKKAFIFAQK